MPCKRRGAFTVQVGFGEGRFSRAVDAEKPDAVIDIEPQIEIAQDGLAVIADGRALELKERRRERPRRR